jgi:hypothetical protein
MAGHVFGTRHTHDTAIRSPGSFVFGMLIRFILNLVLTRYHNFEPKQ